MGKSEVKTIHEFLVHVLSQNVTEEEVKTALNNLKPRKIASLGDLMAEIKRIRSEM